MKKKKKTKPNYKVVIYSLIALGCLAAAVLVHWSFIIIVAILIYLNQKELMKPKK